MIGSRARGFTALVFSTLLPVVLAGCHDDITEVAVVVESDLTIPADVEAMDVASVAGPFAPQASSFFGGSGQVAAPFPLSVGFVSDGETTAFSITVRLFKGLLSPSPALVVSRTVTDIRFVPGQTMMLILPMNRACACQGTSCPGPGNPECDNIKQPALRPFDSAVAPPSSTLGETGSGGGGPIRPPAQGIGPQCRARRLTAARIPGNLPAMELSDLNQDERTALVGLMKLIVMSDGNVSEDELEHVETLVDAFGEGEYQRTLEAFEKRFTDEKSFREFLRKVGREEAREVIFGTVLEGRACYRE